MALLQPKLNLRVAQRQVLTPGLMQMVSVLALNKLELKEMIDAEMVENPVLEEIDETVPMLDEVAGRAERQERLARVERLRRPKRGWAGGQVGAVTREGRLHEAAEYVIGNLDEDG